MWRPMRPMMKGPGDWSVSMNMFLSFSVGRHEVSLCVSNLDHTILRFLKHIIYGY